MADLLDIAPTTAIEVVNISGHPIRVSGLRAPAIAAILGRFPNLVGLFLGGLSIADIGPKFIAQFGSAVGPIIAAGCGHLGDEKYEQHASDALLLEDQLKLVVAIIGITCPNGIGFFGELVANLAAKLGMSNEEAKTAAKVRLKKSPSPSPLSSDADSHQTMS
jgi:hypothetical protein